MAAKAQEPKENKIINDGVLNWPVESAMVMVADRHHTIGQTETVWSIKVVKNDNIDGVPIRIVENDKELPLDYGPELVKRYQPKDRASACRFEVSGITDIQARMLALAAETIKGFDSTTARIAARTFVESYEAHKVQHQLDAIFTSDAFFELTFSTTKSTNPNMGLDDKFVVYATVKQLHAQALWLNSMVDYLDARTPYTVKVTKTAKKKDVAAVAVNLDWTQ